MLRTPSGRVDLATPVILADLGLVDGGWAEVATDQGCVVVAVEVTDAIRPGVVSLPHGWGHDLAGARLSVASARPGVNANRLTSADRVDPLSGNPHLNGFPVRTTAAGPAVGGAVVGAAAEPSGPPEPVG